MQNARSSNVAKMTSRRRTAPACVRNMPNRWSNLQAQALHGHCARRQGACVWERQGYLGTQDTDNSSCWPWGNQTYLSRDADARKQVHLTQGMHIIGSTENCVCAVACGINATTCFRSQAGPKAQAICPGKH